jgi:site-specific DNA recombinase
MNFAGAAAHDSGDSRGKLRAAVYARFSDESQRETSIDDQIRDCRPPADERGWEILDEYIRFDKAKSGRTLAGREGLKELVKLAGQKPRPFDVLLFHSTSRAGRNLSDMLPLVDLLLFYGVELYFVDTGLSSTNPNFRDLLIMYGRNDEHFSKQLGHNVKRGQRGRVLDGHIGCGRVFGYDNVPIEHPTRKGEYGRPDVIGVDHVINSEEGAVVVRIFETRASGIGCLEIARTLNREGVPSPLAKLGNRPRSWSATTILRMLENQKYIGKNIWNQTKQVINPLTGKTNKAPRPRTEWEIIPKPDWRIISDELWATVQYQLKRTDINGQRRGGLNRSRASRSYIFSGVLKCSVCGGNFTVVSGGPAYVRYGCYYHRFRGTCSNATVISRPQLEKQLLDAFARNLADSGLRGEISRSFREQLKQALDAHRTSRRQAAQKHGDLNQARAALEAKRENLIDAIEQYGMSGALQARLDKVEASLREIALLLTAPAEEPREIVSEQEIEAFLEQKMTQIASVLASDPERAKLEVQNRVSALYFEPIDTPSGPGFRVAGDLRLFLTPEDVKVGTPFQMSADLYKSAAVPIETVIIGTAKRRGTSPTLQLPILTETALAA